MGLQALCEKASFEKFHDAFFEIGHFLSLCISSITASVLILLVIV